MRRVRVQIPEWLASRLERGGVSLQKGLIAAAYQHVLGGASGLPEHSTWSNMRQRCFNERATAWEHYGGRGIEVADRWESFWVFLADVGRRPTANHSLDRIDVDGDYEPGNVRWATRKSQSRNRRDNNTLVVGGEKRCLTDWSERSGISVSTIRGRLGAGWSAEEAVSVPPRSRSRLIEFDGEAKSLTEWAGDLGISPAALCTRLRNWSLERALTAEPDEKKVRAGRLRR